MKAAVSKYNFDSERSDYWTPQEIWQNILGFTGLIMFDYDVCCSVKNILANMHYTIKEDGLKQSWKGVCWLNPPFRTMEKWVKKAVSEVKENNCEVWGIMPCRTENKFFKEFIMQNPDAFFVPLRKGVQFLNPDSKNPMGVYKNSLCIVYFGKKSAEYTYKWNWETPFDSVAFKGVKKRIVEIKQLTLLEV
jgi:hypothetical protein